MFGVNGEIRHNVDFVEDAVISYVAGHNLVFYDQMEKRQKFIHGRESASGISSVALCPNKKYIALAEKGDTAAIAVYNIRTLRKFKNLHYDKWSTKEVVNMAFSADNQLLLTLGGAPDWTLVCWNWNKAKVLSYVQVSENFPLYQTSFCPLDASVACVSGKDRLSFYRVLDNELRVIPSSTLTDTNVLCHVWMKQPEDHLVVGTDEGELLVYEKSSLLCKLAQSPKNMGITSGDGDASSFSGPIRIESLVAVSKGFIAGCSNATFRLYSLVTDRPASATDMFQCSCTWSVNDHNSEIMSMSLSPNEDSLVAVLATERCEHSRQAEDNGCHTGDSR
jgi:WD40 repeat protein